MGGRGGGKQKERDKHRRRLDGERLTNIAFAKGGAQLPIALVFLGGWGHFFLKF